MITTWSNSDELSLYDDNHEVANLCLMAHEDEVTSKLVRYFTFKELQEAFNDLLDNLKKLNLKNKE